MKSERITILVTPEFKASLGRIAAEEQLSVGALIRARFEPAANVDESAEERELRRLTDELQRALKQARKSLQDGLAQAERTLHELRQADAGDVQPRQVA